MYVPGAARLYSTPYPYRYNPQEAEVIALILESIQGERDDELFYDFLIGKAPTRQEKEIITGIRDDERKHRQMFRKLYTALTGANAPAGSESKEALPAGYLEGIEKALLGELKAFEKYRKIYLNIRPEYRDWIFEIMTDEIKHAGYYNWLYAKNK
ncbi:ferritin family protein [Paenibacillus sp. UNC499MF]|uniref:ferritin family protein n=1 Tax=Paenibacillus sp. UNC499MF TaxID=1502751 RepID=UPI00089FF1E7|nr:ferritin-like domain-containing protein [Paenibacillus sp. UNC499MF]SEG55984.1 Rubrerythrin [Paenibacillus sp. UNC499MF]